MHCLFADDDTRVKLSGLDTDYINASFIDVSKTFQFFKAEHSIYNI